MSSDQTKQDTPPASTSIPVTSGFPATISPKQKLGETSGSATWEVFDRTKKKKYILKRVKKPFSDDEGVFDRFRDDLLAFDVVRQDSTVWPAVLQIGSDDEGIWYLREPIATKSLAETVSSGKSLREHDAARRFLNLTDLLSRLHQGGQIHRNLKPTNIFLTGVDAAVFVDPDVGHFLDPGVVGEGYDPSIFGTTDFLAPEQRSAGLGPVDVRADLWSLAASLAYALTGKTPSTLDLSNDLPKSFQLLASVLKDDPNERRMTLKEFQAELEQVVRATKPSAFGSTPPNESVAAVEPVAVQPVQVVNEPVAPHEPPKPVPQPVQPREPAAQQPAQPIQPPQAASMPLDLRCPQCQTPVRSSSDRVCSQCGRSFWEPCLNCQSTNPFWVRTCRGCGSDLLALKQKMLATLNGQKQQILKLRETYGHDKTLPLLKYMSTVNHPDFNAFKEWAKSMTALVHKERRDIRLYVENVRAQANAAMEAQKYDKVQQILEQVPRQLLDEPMRRQYVEAGDALTEVDSLIREIRNAIATKQYSQLLSCVQRYLELKANDPEAQNLQQKIEKLTTITTPGGMKFRRIPSGRFYMGSHDTDEYLRNNEHPQHRVQITRSLFVSVYPVTQGDYTKIMEHNTSVSTDNELCPVDSVTWFSAVEFCNKISEAETLPPFYELKNVKRRANGAIEQAAVKVLGGDGYRLLTEAEWEYACRAGSISPWCFGDQVMEVGEYAWYFDNSSMETHPVGEKKPNAWGLYDMHGNVMEWCHDWYGEFYYQQCPDEEENPTGPEDGTSKVLRGGAWQFGAEATRCAYRNSSALEAISSVIGFRVCRNAPGDAM